MSSSYNSLSAQRRSGAGYSRLWLGDDHVLLVTSSGYSEEYRRFFFTDIQAVVIRATRTWGWINLIFGAFLVMFAVFGLLASSPGGKLFLWTIAALSAVAVTINSMFGPSCTVHIRTAIAEHPLEPLGRVRSAQKVIARLRPLIHAAQGELTPEQLAQVTASPATSAIPPTIGS